MSQELSQRAKRSVIDKRVELQIKEYQENETRKHRCLQEEYFRNITSSNPIQKEIQDFLTARDQGLL